MEAARQEPKTKKLFFACCYITVMSATVNVGFALAGYNQASGVITLQRESSNTGLQISLVNDATIIGLGAGCLLASRIVKMGRLRTALLANFIVIIGCFPQMLLSIWLLFFGRLIVGFGAGVLLVTSSIYMQETLPAGSVEPCLTSLNLGMTVGIVIITLIQGLAFNDLSADQLLITKNWRIPFGAPIVSAFVNTLLWWWVMRHDSLSEIIK